MLKISITSLRLIWLKTAALLSWDNMAAFMLFFAPSIPKLSGLSGYELSALLPSKAQKLAYTPRGFWSIHSNQLNYLHWLYDSLGYRSSEDWYRLTSTILIEMHGKPLLRFDYSLTSHLLKLLEYTEDLRIWSFRLTFLNTSGYHGNSQR